MDERLRQEVGVQVYTGTELLLKGALEAGVSLLTGYPGSPVADFFELPPSRRTLLEEQGVVFQIANNEALAAARINGSQMGDLKALAVMKSLGFHVASDGLALGNLAKGETRGGAVIVIGDDPWTDSTQVPADSRFLAQHIHVPIMEPSTFQEIKDWIRIALELSAHANLYVGYLVTTNQVEGGGTVTVFPNKPPTINAQHPYQLDTAKIPLEETVLLPPRTGRREEALDDRMKALKARSRDYQLNRILYAHKRSVSLGFISAGLAYCYLEQALQELGLQGTIPILKLGMTYPIDESLLREFVLQVGEIIVVEERRGFLESQVTSICKDLYQAGLIPFFPKIWGKMLPDSLPGIPSRRGLNPSILIECLAPLLSRMEASLLPINQGHMERAVRLVQETAAYKIHIPSRLPTFCPGCPHRDSASVLLDIKRDFMDPHYMQREHHKGPVDLVFHGDTGCYTMLMFEPYSAIFHSYSGMGLGGGTGAGIDPFITNKQIAFMGDSTFFHSGMVAISDSIKHRQDITYIILDNKTTAMTGHQPTPGNDVDIMGYSTVAQDIEAVIKGMTRGTEIPVVRTNPAYRDTYRRLIEQLVIGDGVKVIIADKECGITYHRRMNSERDRLVRRDGFIPKERHINITPEVCEFCLECTKATGCPGLTIVETPYGPKIATDRSSCVADGACVKIRACPSFEEVNIHRVKPPTHRATNAHPLALPPVHDFERKWSVYIAGVGGMGIGVVTSILVQAGMREGYLVRFAERKGLAIRNGGVYSQIFFARDDSAESPIISYGNADLLLGIDILEAARGLDPQFNLRVGSPQRTTAVVNTAKTPTVTSLIGQEDFNPSELEQYFQPYTKRGSYFGRDFSAVSEERLGNKIYTNLLVVGAAYQKGLLPLKLSSILWAIEQSVPSEEYNKNLEAFRLGRELVVYPQGFNEGNGQLSFNAVLAEKRAILQRLGHRGTQLALAYENLVTELVGDMSLDEITKSHLALRVYDLIQFQSIEYANYYSIRVRAVYSKDRPEFNWEATKVVISELHRVMLIKDEVYVAHLLTSSEKLERDKRRYQVDEANGDRVEYVHFTRPKFRVFGKDIQFDWKSKPWQLRLIKRMKFLRRVVPGWHKEEREFRDWYRALVDEFRYDDLESYKRYVKALRAPEKVAGYREVRYPKMDEARRSVDQLLREEVLSSVQDTVLNKERGVAANM